MHALFQTVRVLVLAAAVLFLTTTAPTAAVSTNLPPPAGRQVSYEKDVQPLLARACYECHGPEKQKGALRLDDKAAALKGGDTGPLFILGKSGESLLIQAVTGNRPELDRMPKKRDPLSNDEIGLLRAWIDQGAVWPEAVATKKKDWKTHWAFQAPVRPSVPTVKNRRWIRNPIDAFILARLEKEKIPVSPEADQITLLRRLSLDLIGLPPTPGEVDAFLADHSDQAYDRQVDRLLASPHYGERWGRHWLDAARYADSDGFEKDKSRNVWFYRDWVINALNQDLPYDRFVIEQIAGDQLSNPTQDQIVATGFLRNSMINEEGGVDPEQFRMDAMFDRMDCIGKSVLGLTIQCAQCHNHKFDPLTQEEYYRLFSFLNNDHEAQRVVYRPEEQMKVANLSRQMRDLEAALRQEHPGWEERMREWEDQHRRDQPEWIVLRPIVDGNSDGGQRYLPQADGSFLALSYAPTKHTGKFWLTNDLQNITAFRLELFTDPNLPCDGPGRSFKGTCALTEFKVDSLDAAAPTNRVKVKFSKATADFEQPERPLEPNFFDKTDKKRSTGPAAFAIDDKDETAWGIDAGPGRRNQERKAVFQCETNVGFPGGTILGFQLVQNHGGWNSDDHMNNNLGRFRISATTNAAPGPADPLPKRVRDLFAIPRERRSPAQTAALFTYWRTTVPAFKAVNDKIEDLWKEWPNGSTALTLMAREEPRDTRVLKRGDWLKPTAPVEAGFPAFLHRPAPATADTKDAGSRLSLARWLVDKNSPTTARVLVNRLWQSYFGVGLVSTPEDFGMQSEAPSHPELLDWLACEFMQPTPNTREPSPQPWSVKHVQRLIVTSAAYRQASRMTPDQYAKDPYNRLLARGPRLRVEAEIVRDIALSTSGLLNPKVGGPSIFSPAPDFLFLPPASYAPFPWKEETGPDRYRRALYTFRRRSTPFPALQVFDAPNGDFSCVRRMRSNTPLQALVSLNETVFVECAQALARNTLQHGGKTDGDRVTYAFRRALSRAPNPKEKAELLALLEKQNRRLAEGWVNANEIATGKNEAAHDLPAGVTPTQLAAYTVVSRVLLNLDETITKE
ncbi:MAG TPA: PSD1 and planctomycete cytochrome C domain-containing protein [Methylomirabilota bacterium]|nr:PSD1 and planctomycete cytochrome C domain-containing protein [Methylomirabilota bacterium]